MMRAHKNCTKCNCVNLLGCLIIAQNLTRLFRIIYTSGAYVLSSQDFDSTSANDFVGEYSIPFTSIRSGEYKLYYLVHTLSFQDTLRFVLTLAIVIILMNALRSSFAFALSLYLGMGPLSDQPFTLSYRTPYSCHRA